MFKVLLLSALMFFIGYWFFSSLGKFLGRKGRQNERSKQQSNQQEEKRFSKDIGEYVSYEEVEDKEK